MTVTVKGTSSGGEPADVPLHRAVEGELVELAWPRHDTAISHPGNPDGGVLFTPGWCTAVLDGVQL
ncbi:hypothetical protein EYF80_056610 [Liparis tanakae]|uniref:Uncharacterized protein n=1 Tax=Liparis tanakae TaxID=230148 RepID=A0A4Z2EY13_9TELE|nr:hypothetical protein EYF80_056610 [Liparis tanakae]